VIRAFQRIYGYQWSVLVCDIRRIHAWVDIKEYGLTLESRPLSGSPSSHGKDMGGCTLSSDCRAVSHHTKTKYSDIITLTRTRKSNKTYLSFLDATSIARLEDMLPLNPKDALISLILARS
jgi:hypothetical protein